MSDTIELEKIVLAYIYKVKRVPTVRAQWFSGDIHQALYALSTKQSSPISPELARVMLKKNVGKKENYEEYERVLDEIYDVATKTLTDNSMRDITSVLEEEARLSDCVVHVENALEYLQKKDTAKAKEHMRKALRVDDANEHTSYLDNYERRLDIVKQRADMGNVGVPMGINKFDATFGGVLATEYAVILGESGLGKSMFMENAALAAWLPELNIFHRGHNVIYISLEMTVEELEYRADANLAEVVARKYRTGKLDDADFKKWDRKIKDLRSGHDKYLCFEYLNRGADVDAVFEVVDYVQDKYGQPVDAVYIDSINLCGGSKEWDAQAQVSADIKHYAQSFNGGGTAVFGCTQIKESKRELSVFDSKYSQAIMHDAVIGIGLVQPKELKASGEIELQWIKFRHGKKIAPLRIKPYYEYMRMTDHHMLGKTVKAKTLGVH